MELPLYNGLDTTHLQRLFDNKSESYKLFWFQAIVNKVHDGCLDITFDDLVNDMIADSWYMVSEYRLNLGPADNLEALVHYAGDITKLRSSEKSSEIIDALNMISDPELARRKKILVQNVPYRLQAPFLNDIKGKSWDGKKTDLMGRINSHPGLIYTLEGSGNLDSVIHVSPVWADYIRKNYEIITGWLRYDMISYLQRRNPSVPGIPNKLDPPQKRDLGSVISYWKSVLTVEPMKDIYAEQYMTSKGISIDHFVPWSYVTHDELWNLSPTTRSINSRKSNHLPEWDIYFSRLCDIEYEAYRIMWESSVIHEQFDKCAREHVNDTDILQRLYRQGLDRDTFGTELRKVIEPVYTGARNLGFDEWRMTV